MEENKMRIPEGWGNKYGYEIFKVQGGYAFKSDDYKDEGVILVRIGNVGNGKFQYKDVVYIPKRYLKSHKNFLLTKGDVLMGLTGDLGKICILKNGNFPFILNQRVAKFNPINFSTDYLNYLLSSQIVQNNFDALFAGGAQKNISPANIEGLKYLIPKSLTEQKKIAEILSTVDKAIEQTEQLIAKYQRIKTGLMQDLLTKGIDENGNIRSEETHKFKDSPLGRIPLEWEVVELGKGIKKIDAGKSLQCPNKPAGHNQWGIIKVSAINNKGFKEVENKVLMNEILVNKEYRINHNDFLISRANTQNLVGDVCIVNRPSKNLLLSDKSLRLKLKSKIFNKEFIFYSLLKPSSRIQIETNATGSSASMKNISQESIFKLLIAIPYDIFEQETIVHKIESNIKVVNSLNIEFKKLQRIKTALMQDLLSGQKRVTHLLKEEAL